MLFPQPTDPLVDEKVSEGVVGMGLKGAALSMMTKLASNPHRTKGIRPEAGYPRMGAPWLRSPDPPRADDGLHRASVCAGESARGRIGTSMSTW